MSDHQITATLTVVLAIISSILLGMGTNAFIGTSLFFGLWAIAGIFQIYE